MRGLLVLAAAVAVARSAAGGAGVFAHHAGTYHEGNLSSVCHKITQKMAINAIGAERLSASNVSIVLTWASEAERAASSVLALACRCAGVRRVHVEQRTADDRFTIKKGWHVALSALSDVFYNVPDGVAAVGWGVVQVKPRLHMRLAPPAARDAARCVYKASFYPGRNNISLRSCLLLKRSKYTTAYIPKEWSTVADRDLSLYEQFKTILKFLNNHNMSLEYISWVELEKLVQRESNESFLFVDADLWEGVESVWLVTDVDTIHWMSSVLPPVCLVEHTIRATVPSLWNGIRNFKLNASDILEILVINISDPLQAALTWALQRPYNRARLLEWIHLFTKPTPLNMAVLLCDDLNATDYEYLLNAISYKMTNLTIDMNYISINLKKSYINCSSETSWIYINEFLDTVPLSYRSIRMVISGEGVYEIVRDDEEYLSKPLPAYSMKGSLPVFPLGGTPEALVQSLQQFLHNCSVRRIAVISEVSDVADHVTAALHQLHNIGALTSRDVLLSNTSEEVITGTLNSLVNDNARYFLVNGDTRFTNNIIRVAKELQLTPERGYLWIVREWEGPGDETMKPYEATFAYRGGENVASAELRDLERRLDDRWRNSTWPRHAASVANAVLTVGIALTRLTITDPNVTYNFYTHTTYRLLLKYSGSLPSMIGELRIEKQVVKNPRMFVYRWASEYPTLVAGGAGHAAGGCPLSMPHDGSIACLTSSDGEAFPPKCNDIIWLIVGIAITLTVLIFVVTTISCRRASRAREKRLIEEADKMGRARLDAFTSSLAPYFVERKELKLQYQIGAGRFGLVWFGILHEPTGGIRPVAAKALREGAVAEEQSEFFREARNLAVLQQDHVIRFVGVCVAGGPPLLLMEHASFGDLLKYLSNRRHLVENRETDSTEAQYVSAAALTRFAREAATALAFIVRRGFVHRDVRAVNCLINEKRMLKLADFGMAREMSEAGNEHDGEYWCRRRALFPVLWMAPESLSRGVFSIASDIWSLGVLMLEVLTLGARPYGGRSPLTVVELVVVGGRPPLPRDISAAARELLLQCWRRTPAERPTADAVAAWLEENPLALQPALADTRTVL